jgi:hypothetical protein
MSYSIDDNDFRPRPPLAGGHQIAQSLVQGPGWNPFDDPYAEDNPNGGGGGSGGRFGISGQRAGNDMERTIDAHNYPGGFKVATDQYAAKYSDQLDAAALLEMKHKYPNGPASGGTWDEFAIKRQANINNYQNTGQLWGPNGPTGRTENSPVASSIYSGYKHPTMTKSNAPLSGVADRDRSGLVSRNPVRRIGANTALGVSPGGGNSRRTGRIGGRYGL